MIWHRIWAQLYNMEGEGESSLKTKLLTKHHPQKASKKKKKKKSLSNLEISIKIHGNGRQW